MLSQSGFLSATPFIVIPTNRLTRVRSRNIQVAPLTTLSLSFSSCHSFLALSTSSATTGEVLGRRGYALESAIARICREGGASFSASQCSRRPTADAWRSSSTVCRSTEVRSSQSTPRWSALFDATEPPDPEPLAFPAPALEYARRRKERTYREIAGEGGRARLVKPSTGTSWAVRRWCRKVVRGDQTLPWRAGEGQSPHCFTGAAVQCHDGLAPAGGLPSSLARRLGLSRSLSPNTVQLLMAPCPRCTRWCRIKTLKIRSRS